MAPDAAAPAQTLQERVYQELRESIMLGRIRPGEAMTIRGLADTVGTSMMPVREALRRLVAERALELRPNRRVSVPHMQPDTFMELTDARVALEVLAARRAFVHTDAALADRMEAIDARQDDAIASGDWGKYQEYNHAFHFALYERAPGRVLMPLIESLWLQIGPFLYLTRKSLEKTYLDDHHKEAVTAIRARDKNALAQAIEQDVRNGMGGLPALLAAAQSGVKEDNAAKACSS